MSDPAPFYVHPEGFEPSTPWSDPSLFCVRPVGFEPTTTWSEAKCSIQLSYGRSQKSEGLSS